MSDKPCPARRSASRTWVGIPDRYRRTQLERHGGDHAGPLGGANHRWSAASAAFWNPTGGRTQTAAPAHAAAGARPRHNWAPRHGQPPSGTRAANAARPSPQRHGLGSGAAPVNGAGRNRSGTPRLAAGALQGGAGLLTEHPGDPAHRHRPRARALVRRGHQRARTPGRRRLGVRTNDRPRRYSTRTHEPVDPPAPHGQAQPADSQADGQP